MSVRGLVLAAMLGCGGETSPPEAEVPSESPGFAEWPEIEASIETYASTVMSLDLAPVEDAMRGLVQVGERGCPSFSDEPDGTEGWSHDCVTAAGVRIFGTHRQRLSPWDDLEARALEGPFGEQLEGWAGSPVADGAWYRSYMRVDLRGGTIDVNGVYSAYSLQWLDGQSWTSVKVGGPVHVDGQDGWGGIEPDVRWERVRTPTAEAIVVDGYVGGLEGAYPWMSATLEITDVLVGLVLLRDEAGVWTEVHFDGERCGEVRLGEALAGHACPSLAAWSVP